MTPEFLSIGHVCHDAAPLGYIPGGAVTYASLFAQRLGLSTALLTSAGADYLFHDLFRNINMECIPAKETTLFDNQQLGEQRQQYLRARAADLSAQHLPLSWRLSKMVFIGPIADEVSSDFLPLFEKSLVCINPQGWMRKWDAAGKVTYEFLKNYEILMQASVTIFSEEDFQADYSLIETLTKHLNVLVVTKGAKGCDLYTENRKVSFPAFPTLVKDTTGAGDIFSAAFLIFYNKTGSLEQAAKYGNVAASFCVEGQGITTLPTMDQLKKRYQIYSTSIN